MKKLFVLMSAFATASAIAQEGHDCPTIFADPYTDCAKGITHLNALPGFDSYSWSPAGSVSNPNIANPTTTTPGMYTVTATVLNGPELVTNGDLALGNSGFTSGMTYSSVYTPCDYFVGPGWFSSVLDPTKPDHTATTDNMFMSIDGCTTPTVLWEETMGVSTGTNYTFSFWATEADAVQPNFEIHFIGNVTGDVVVATQTGIPYTGTWTWDQYGASCWNSGLNTSVTVRVVNLETNSYGNDFGMDDFSFRQCCTSSYSVWAPTNLGQNLFVNWDFSAGNSGFLSGMTYSSVYTPCDYFVGPGWFSSTLDPTTPDHTPTSDNMYMSVDGCSPATVLWEETVPVTPGTVYHFSFWATEADQVQPIFEMHFIGNATGDVIVNTQTGIPYSGTWTWDEYGVPCWNSGHNTSVTVRIVNLEINSFGNDFGLDDFSFRQCCNPDECCNRIPNGRTGAPAETGTSFDIVPNPASGNFRIELPDASENAHVEIMSLTGELVDEFSFSGTSYEYAPKQPLAPGVYMVRITSGNEQYSKRLVIE